MEKQYIQRLSQIKKVGSKLYIDASQDGNPVGTILYTASPTPPPGYLICNGAIVGRQTYPDLFNAIGTTYGEGDGNSTFQLPNLMGKTVWGSTTVGTEKEAGLPNIEGGGNSGGRIGVQGTDVAGFIANVSSGALYTNDSSTYAVNNASNGIVRTGSLYFDASRSNAIYGNSDTVQPPALTLLPVIKAFGQTINTGNLDISQLPNEIAKCLPLAGGTMTGAITTTLNDILNQSVNSRAISIHGGQYWDVGATLELVGKDRITNPGSFLLEANDGSSMGRLFGKPDGTLTWNSKNIEIIDSSGIGWVRYTNGLQICFGRTAGTLSGNYFYYFYPKPFTTLLGVCATADLSPEDPGFYTVRLINSLYRDTTLYWYNFLAGVITTNQPLVDYIAFGYWK